MMGEGDGEVKEPDLLQFLNVLNPQAMFHILSYQDRSVYQM